MNQSDNNDPQENAGALLRGAGLRSTPQRRAILAAFRGGALEHLSADEVYARAALSVPDLGRGTVYATLAEFTETGLLAAYGTPEPVRYETNVGPHAHFRCRLCLRVYDVDAPPPDPAPFEAAGHSVERADVRAEGICSECHAYGDGVRSGVEAITNAGASERLSRAGVAAIELDTPIGPLLIAATAAGVARVAFPEHGDVAYLRGLLDAAVPEEVRAHLDDARAQLSNYFSGEAPSVDCLIDWELIDEADALQAALTVPFGAQRSYHQLVAPVEPGELGHSFGSNPVAILAPCHRVTEGIAPPEYFVGGVERRAWLLEHERESA